MLDGTVQACSGMSFVGHKHADLLAGITQYQTDAGLLHG